MNPDTQDTIVALATSSGKGAIGIIRLSGSQAIQIADTIFEGKHPHTLLNAKANSVHFGTISYKTEVIDECLCSVFKSPHSYTGEDSVEISIHPSVYIENKIIIGLMEQGARIASRGEFTRRAFLNGKMDLSQAEAVADLIKADSKEAHSMAFKQLRGEYHNMLLFLSKKLTDLASLLELELDFSEEDVEFASRSELVATLNTIQDKVKELLDSYEQGNALKEGYPVSIVGKTNVGKSTLLNALLGEQRAIVSSIAGTTTDTIEERLNIEGITFRFIDTAGIRQTKNSIEQEGQRRSFRSMELSQAILLMEDATTSTLQSIKEDIENIQKSGIDLDHKHLVLVMNKCDKKAKAIRLTSLKQYTPVLISAKEKENLDKLKKTLVALARPADMDNSLFLTSQRHFEALSLLSKAIEDAQRDIQEGKSADLVSISIRQALQYIGEITGQVTTEDILSNIFSSFCIGK